MHWKIHPSKLQAIFYQADIKEKKKVHLTTGSTHRNTGVLYYYRIHGIFCTSNTMANNVEGLSHNLY